MEAIFNPARKRQAILEEHHHHDFMDPVVPNEIEGAVITLTGFNESKFTEISRADIDVHMLPQSEAP